MRALKRLLRRGYARIQERRWVRRLVTANFSSGKLAVGEQNRYGIRPDWITVDVEGADVTLDFRRRVAWPFPDHSQSLIYSAHTVEHIDESALAYLLRECYRVLKPGGAIRIEAPDLEKTVQAYRQGDRTVLDPLCQENRRSLVDALRLPEVYAEDHMALLGLASSYIDERNGQIPVFASREEVEVRLASLSLEAFGQWCVSLQTAEQRVSGGHVTPIYFEKLRRLLAEAGFREIARRENGVTGIAGLVLRNLERPHRAGCSLYVEARK
ncbi:MAG: methyltransferase domain-containing protein [Candidatus Omnitrophica bacterium]|nr:methyltransferase domain-containing protein [Candidatus Omnitrophota bacterium]